VSRDPRVKTVVHPDRVGLKTYEEAALPGAEVAVAVSPAALLEQIPGDVLQCVVDGEEYLAALLTPGSDTVHGAVWTGDRLLAGLQHNGMAAELAFTRMLRLAMEDAPAEEIRAVYPALSPLLWRASPGFGSLRESWPRDHPPAHPAHGLTPAG
jgi:hypothetical protein